MASHAASAVGAMASQAACDIGRKADDLTASAGAGIRGLGDRIGKNVRIRVCWETPRNRSPEASRTAGSISKAPSSAASAKTLPS